MSDIIQVLPDSVANQIAAGEVVQRPASIVKELVENSIDAGATDVKIEILNAGKTLVRIVDNGCGMSPTDARMAFERHATSKIRLAKDLFAIRTMGFRGEALASIAAVAEVELKTKPHDQELGTEIVVKGSTVEKQEAIAFRNGTTFSIKNLFYNIPARRKFLKKEATEFRHIVTELQRIALPNAHIGFELVHNHNTIYDMKPEPTKKRISSVLGPHFNDKLLPVEEDTSVVKIKGFLGLPQTAKKNLGDQYFFVNNRFVKHPYLHKAVSKAFEGIIPADSYPGYVLFLDIDPCSVDINIHPTKTEVKFDEEPTLWKILHAGIRKCLTTNNITPTIDFNATGKVEIPYDYKKGEMPKQPSVTVNKNYSPFKKDSGLNSWDEFYKNKHLEPKSPPIPPTHTEPQSGQLTLSTPEEMVVNADYMQWQKKYLVTPVKSGLLFVNQNLAHQRILFEKILKQKSREHPMEGQTILFPVEMSLNPNEINILRSVEDELNRYGLRLTFEDGGITITQMPPFVKIPAETFVQQLIHDLETTAMDLKTVRDETIAKIMAKTEALPVGTAMGVEEIRNLINKLFACADATHSPYGKPIAHIVKTEEIEKLFGG